jgi:hypothetical protein
MPPRSEETNIEIDLAAINATLEEISPVFPVIMSILRILRGDFSPSPAAPKPGPLLLEPPTIDLEATEIT